MRRREFLGLVGGLSVLPVPVCAQRPNVPVIGYVSARTSEAEEPLRGPFLLALAEEGFANGRNLGIECRFADGNDTRLAVLARDLIDRRVVLIVATDRASAEAAKAATATIPIVFASGFDPVRLGLVASFGQPGGNATGVSVLTSELGPKRLGLMRELLPSPGVIAFIVNTNANSTPAQVEEMQAAAAAIGQALEIVGVASEADVERAFTDMAARRIAAVIFAATPLFQVISRRLIVLAAEHRIPALYEWREFVTAGGLMSYSTHRREVGRVVGAYAGRILKGERPADMPVVQSTHFEFVINARTARSLGLDVPPALLARADEVIE